MIYYVEDDTNIRDLVIYVLGQMEFEVKGFPDAECFYAALAEELPELVILDIMLPGEDGLSILSKLKKREDTADIPVIMLTAKGAEYDKVRGLDGGADDYIAKPFGMMEFVSRVKAVLRRSKKEFTLAEEPKASNICFGNVHMDLQQHTIFVDKTEIKLTLKEYQLLQCLLEEPGKVFTRDELLEKVWGYDSLGGTRTVDVHIQTLRQKLGTGADIILTVRGVGYKAGSQKTE